MPVKGLPNNADDCDDLYNNDDRAEWVDAGLIAFAKETGQIPGIEIEDIVCDFLADLGHWCDRHKVDLQAALHRAAFHYDAETQGKGKQLIDNGEYLRG